jgi:CelD/BcsL family acetyltransferase involved in cellulose biosynthesis
MSRLRVEPITDYEAFRSLESIWNPFLERTETAVPFLTHEWLTTWWECFSDGAEMLVLAARRGDELTGLAPLIVDKTTRRVSFMANAHSARAAFLLADEPEQSLKAIFAYLAGRGVNWESMVLNYVPEDSPVPRLCAAACRQAGLRVGSVPSLISPYISLEGLGWDRYLEQRTSRFRRNLRSHEKRLLEREDGRTALYLDPDDIERALEACREVALTTWQHAQGASLASSPRVWEFYRRLARVAARRGWLRIGIVEARGEPAAFEYALLFGGSAYSLKIGYRLTLRDCAPGNALRAFMIRQAIAEGAREYDLLGMNEGYNMDWATGVRTHTCLRVAGRGLVGGVRHWCEFGAKPRLRRWPAAVAAKRWCSSRLGRPTRGECFHSR